MHTGVQTKDMVPQTKHKHQKKGVTGKRQLTKADSGAEDAEKLVGRVADLGGGGP